MQSEWRCKSTFEKVFDSFFISELLESNTLYIQELSMPKVSHKNSQHYLKNSRKTLWRKIFICRSFREWTFYISWEIVEQHSIKIVMFHIVKQYHMQV